MRIGTELSIRTVASTMRIMRTELFFIFLIIIVLFHERMCKKTVIAIRTFLFLLDIAAHLIMIEISKPLSIFCIVIIYAMLMIMSLSDIARVYFKCI